MNARSHVLILSVMFSLVGSAALAEWEPLAVGVDYRSYSLQKLQAHVARIDLREGSIRVIASRESERGLRVSEFARRNKAIAAINGDYFDQDLQPIGLSIGPCGQWEDTLDTKREGFLALGMQRAEIFSPRRVVTEPPNWVEHAISGWPMIVDDCKALTDEELPGSDHFTRAPHPRTAVGLTRDGRYLFFVVADGRREGVPGLTLGELARFMRRELGVCRALNLDGGGSSAMYAGDAIVNRPSDGSERRVSNHLAVVWRDEYEGCTEGVEAAGTK